MDEALRDYIVLLRPDKWPNARGMVPSATWNSTRMPARALVIYSGCWCHGILYYETVLAGPLLGFQTAGHIATLVCK